MGRIFQPLLFLLARCTRNALIRRVEWLKAENEVLRCAGPPIVAQLVAGRNLLAMCVLSCSPSNLVLTPWRE
jgi:hypothetical protein